MPSLLDCDILKARDWILLISLLSQNLPHGLTQSRYSVSVCSTHELTCLELRLHAVEKWMEDNVGKRSCNRFMECPNLDLNPLTCINFISENECFWRFSVSDEYILNNKTITRDLLYNNVSVVNNIVLFTYRFKREVHVKCSYHNLIERERVQKENTFCNEPRSVTKIN